MIHHGWSWSTIEKSSLCWPTQDLWSESWERFFLLAQPQSVLHFWDVCDWFRFIISLHFSERCKVTPPWGYGVCSVNEICANTQDLCERSDLLARFERLQASQSHRLTPHICIGQCLFGAWKFWKANGREICDFVWKNSYSVLANIDPDALTVLRKSERSASQWPNMQLNQKAQLTKIFDLVFEK